MLALNENEANEKLSSYAVSRGELKYKRLISVSDTGEEKYYKNKNNALGLFIGLVGAKLGMEQTSQYGNIKDYKKGLTKETIDLIKEVVK